MFKMQVFDIDGTLVDKDKRVPQENIKATERMHKLGAVGVIATARPMESAMYIAEQFGDSIDYIVGTNGSFIYDIKAKKYIFEQSINDEAKTKIAEVAEAEGLEIFMMTKEEEICDRQYLDKHKDKMHDNMGKPFASIDNLAEYIRNTEEAIQLLAIYGTEEKLLEFVKKINNSSIQITQPQSTGNMINGNQERYVDIMPEGIHKATSILWLAERLGINQKEIVAFGDGENDIEMLEAVGIAVAMENAEKAVKKVTRFVSVTNNEARCCTYIRCISRYSRKKRILSR